MLPKRVASCEKRVSPARGCCAGRSQKGAQVPLQEVNEDQCLSLGGLTPDEIAKANKLSEELELHTGEDYENAIVQPMRSPYQPTPEEVDAHEMMHCPERQWCRACVAGRGRSDKHLDNARSGILKCGVDYGYMCQPG